MPTPLQPIGVFDSGYGGLTILRELVGKLPQYDYVYLGDNARTPYGTRSFETVYQYTLECVQHLFDRGCRLVILACNTASAKALRNIQQLDLPKMDGPNRRVLGVIRPTTEVIGTYSRTGQVGVLGTRGTVTSESYVVEIEKFFPELRVFQEACPMWVPLVENGEYDSPGADYFVRQHIDRLLGKSPGIDTILLACTHYPLLLGKIRQYTPIGTTILSQGRIVADSLADYLLRHPELEVECSKHGQRAFLTTDSPADFDRQATVFYGEPIQSMHLAL
ncbi:glutamate racemase [Spirosoma utsteinense]|uniref:glutamate racemase n=1 Tax=Spirosoma utsteinense TaxID=2585773 RepID=UPI001646E6D0|nr:glutamate racemase [Spirosoma utsteinense]MBC3785161.1 glutamate racemase [Spirosoma utsteinense]